jgi:tetratricopeptide (TPR) repeat protein
MQNIFGRITKISLYLLTFLLPLFFLPFSFEAFEFNKQYLLFFLVSLGFLSWLAKMVFIDKEIRFKKSPLDIPIIIFFFISVLSGIFSVDWFSSLVGFYGRFSNGLINLLSFVMMYFLITNNVSIKSLASDSEDKNQSSDINQSSLINIFLSSVSVIVLTSYLSLLGVWGKILDLLNLASKAPSFLQQKIFNFTTGSLEGLSIFLSIIVVLTIGLILIQKEKQKSLFYWILMIASFGLIMIADFAASWITISASLIVFLVFVLAKRAFSENVNMLLLPIIISVIALVFLFVNINVFNLQLPKEQVLGQNYSWSIGFNSATESIKSGFLGSGIGTWYYDFSKFKPREFNQNILWQYRFDRSESHMSEVLGTTGFLGFVSYLILIGMFLLASWFIFNMKLSSKDFSVQLPLLMSFLAVLIGQFVYYQNTVLAFAFWLILGLSVVNWQKPSSEKTISFKNFPELSLVFSTLMIVLCLLTLGTYFFGARFYLADVNFRNSLATDDISKIEKATRLNPYQSQYKTVLSRKYLVNAISEAQKPVEQIDKNILSNNVASAISYAKGNKTVGLKGATELSPNWVATWETLGVIYREIQGLAEGSIDFGISSFEKALSLEPENPVLHTEIGKLYLNREIEKTGEEYFNSENVKRAVEELKKAIDCKPDYVEASFLLGALYYNSNQLDLAITYLEKAANFVPSYSNVRYTLGLAYAKKGDKQKAIAELEAVLQLNPGNQDVQSKLDELRQ